MADTKSAKQSLSMLKRSYSITVTQFTTTSEDSPARFQLSVSSHEHSFLEKAHRSETRTGPDDGLSGTSVPFGTTGVFNTSQAQFLKKSFFAMPENK